MGKSPAKWAEDGQIAADRTGGERPFPRREKFFVAAVDAAPKLVRMTCSARNRKVRTGQAGLLFDNLVVITSILIFSQFRTGFENGIRLLMKVRGRCQKEVCLPDKLFKMR